MRLTDGLTMRWIDNHCHLEADELESTLEQAIAAGVQAMIDVGTNVDSSTAAIAKAATSSRVWATAGVHPHEASNGSTGIWELLGSERVVAVGETGLDYHYNYSPAGVQQEVFGEHIQMAHHQQMPLMIHTRQAWDDTFALLDEAGMVERTVFHCFTGGPDEARAALDRGAFLSFSGIVSFPSADEVRDAAKLCPLDRLLVETDSPYLTPVPLRGKPNSPANVPLVGQALAQVYDIAIEEIAHHTWQNAVTFYQLSM
ncbi:MAG: TatD family deoxyribonuclease [Acidimicrobiia bacterium]|nr:TatD family deoxyribonuclease [Acidimicrobiia bacterium]